MPACAACKFQRRKCKPNCLLRPYFPQDEEKCFKAVHDYVGIGNLKRMLTKIQPNERDEQVRSIIFDAEQREKNPRKGSLGVIDNLQTKVWKLEKKCKKLQGLSGGSLNYMYDPLKDSPEPGGVDNGVHKAKRVQTQELSPSAQKYDEFPGDFTHKLYVGGPPTCSDKYAPAPAYLNFNTNDYNGYYMDGGYGGSSNKGYYDFPSKKDNSISEHEWQSAFGCDFMKEPSVLNSSDIIEVPEYSYMDCKTGQSALTDMDQNRWDVQINKMVSHKDLSIPKQTAVSRSTPLSVLHKKWSPQPHIYQEMTGLVLHN